MANTRLYMSLCEWIKSMQKILRIIKCSCLAVSIMVPMLAWSGSLEKALDTQVKTDLAAKKSQEQVDVLSEETAQILIEYREILREKDSLRAYNDQLDRLVNSQKRELISITEQLSNIETTQRDILPLLLNMVDVLGRFLALDVPFLPEERQIRLIELEAMMDRADVSLAEKYRRVMEAYQVETEYGRTIEAYQGNLSVDDESRTVDFLRIGRVALYYLSLNGAEAGVWDQESRQWQILAEQYQQPVSQGLKVARKQLPPDLLVLPVKTLAVTK